MNLVVVKATVSYRSNRKVSQVKKYSLLGSFKINACRALSAVIVQLGQYIGLPSLGPGFKSRLPHH